VEKDTLETLLGQGLSLEKIAKRFGKDAATISYWMRKYGLQAVNREKHAAKGGIDQEHLARLVAEGMTIAEIAAEVGLSKTAVRHWLRRHGLKTAHGRGRRPAGETRVASDGAPRIVTLECRHHGRAEFVLEGRGYYRCRQCRIDRVTRRRRSLKVMLVAEAGGCCVICGYDRHLRALAFHHVEPADKRLQISWNGVTQSLEALRAEAQKCVLLCSNCHAEVEDGRIELPARVSVQPRDIPL
jgi:transposase/5-methylcytosine-specific restriction endonuclease McrA